MTTAYITANPDNITEAVAASVCAMGLCGELAYERLGERDGNSSYRDYIIDEVYNLTAEKLENGAKYEIR
jgi:hydroxyethylthiazole kinase